MAYQIASLSHIWDRCLGTVTESDDDGNTVSSINTDIQEPSDPYLCPTVNDIDLEEWGLRIVDSPTKDYDDTSDPDGNLIRKPDLTHLTYDTSNTNVFTTAGVFTISCTMGDVAGSLSYLWSLGAAWYLSGYLTVFSQDLFTNGYISHGSPVGTYEDLAVSNYQYNFYDGTVFYGVGVDSEYSTDGTWSINSFGRLNVNIADDFSVTDDGQSGYSCIDIATLASNISSTLYLYIYGHVECYYGAVTYPYYTHTKCLYGVQISTDGTWKIVQEQTSLPFPEFSRKSGSWLAVTKVNAWLYFSIGI